jgi:hypothetical protein
MIAVPQSSVPHPFRSFIAERVGDHHRWVKHLWFRSSHPILNRPRLTPAPRSAYVERGEAPAPTRTSHV